MNITEPESGTTLRVHQTQMFYYNNLTRET